MNPIAEGEEYEVPVRYGGEVVGRATVSKGSDGNHTIVAHLSAGGLPIRGVISDDNLFAVKITDPGPFSISPGPAECPLRGGSDGSR